MAGAWKERLAAVGQSLLTLEINTVVTTGLSAQKMPEIPLALHTLVQGYSDYLAIAGFQVTLGLLDAAARRVGGIDNAATSEGGTALLRQLQAWPFPQRQWTAAEKKAGLPAKSADAGDSSGIATDLTNGAETFEALQWAAWAALQSSRAGASLPAEVDVSVLSRINANCRQLKEAALRLERQHDPRRWWQRLPLIHPLHIGVRRSAERLLGLTTVLTSAAAAAKQQEKTPQVLFGGTVEQTARALFDHPRPVFSADPDVSILIRKAWDVGVQRVCMQTVLQVDGDVMQVVGDLKEDERAFVMLLHKQAVQDSASQWRSFFDLLRQLMGDIGKVVMGG